MSYRENCYHCRFACAERQGDITIADYHGLGLCAPASFSSRKVSLVLINTGKGKAFVEELVSGGRVHVEPRPLEEPFKGEPQLRHPSVKSKYRMAFEKEIVRHGGHQTTAKKIYGTDENRRCRVIAQEDFAKGKENDNRII